MDIMKYTTEITLYNSYFDCNNKLKPTAIFNIFQDVASYHGEILGVGYKNMLAKNLYWVLSRVRFDVLKQPEIDSVVVVETWPNAKGKVDFDRDYRITNKSGETLIIGSSKWCVISSITRTLERTDNVNYPQDCINEKVYEEKLLKTPSLLEQPTENYKHTVSYSEIDHNNHLNNVFYATYVTNALGNGYFNHLQINFISECKLNDEIKLYINHEVNNETIISGYVNGILKFSALTK